MKLHYNDIVAVANQQKPEQNSCSTRAYVQIYSAIKNKYIGKFVRRDLKIYFFPSVCSFSKVTFPFTRNARRAQYARIANV